MIQSIKKDKKNPFPKDHINTTIWKLLIKFLPKKNMPLKLFLWINTI